MVKKEPTWESLLSLAKSLDERDGIVNEIKRLTNKRDALKDCIKDLEGRFDHLSKEMEIVDDIIRRNCTSIEH